MDLTSLARPEILRMRPYASARLSMSAEGILLNANEAPAPLLDDDDFTALALHRYPSPQPQALLRRLAGLYGAAPERLLVTRGSDEGIDLLVRVFCRPGVDAIAECTPCFGMYRVAAAIQGAAVLGVPRLPEEGFRIDVDALCSVIERERPRLVFLTSPNNPTGDGIGSAELERILTASAGRALVVVDEAYVEFSARPSAVEMLEGFPQLVVLRTLSKAWAAAALRCGAVIADPQVIALLQRVMAPYPLTSPAVEAALRVTEEPVRIRQRAMIEAVLAEKARFVERLSAFPWVQALWPGEANFVLARVDDARALTESCGARGIRIRNFDGQPMLDACVRFSIGTAQDMRALTEALRQYGKTDG